MKISNVLKLFVSVLMLSFGTSAIADTLSDTKAQRTRSMWCESGTSWFLKP